MRQQPQPAERILDVALSPGAASAWEAVHPHAIASEPGMSLNEVRRYFPQKDDLVEAWFDRADRAALALHDGSEFAQLSRRERLLRLIMAWLAPVLGRRFALDTVSDTALREELQTLSGVRGRALSLLPEATFMRLDDPAGPSRYFTLLRNTGHSNVTHLADEMEELRPQENTLTVVPGFIGAYPNALYVAPRDALPEFTAAVRGLASEEDYRALADRFAIRRTHPQFWTYSDALQDTYARLTPIEAGLFDYNRLETH